MAKSLTGTTILHNGETKTFGAWTIEAIPMYILPRGRVFHLDLYRLGPDGAWGLGLDEELGPGDFLVAEWPGEGGPWEGRWVGRLGFISEGEGRRAEWTTADAPPAG